MTAWKKLITSAGLCLLFFTPVLRAAGIAAKPGDVNADSSLDVRDLYGLVRCLAGRDSATAAADLDRNGRIEFHDAMLYIDMTLSMREKRPAKPQFVVAIGSGILDSPAVTTGWIVMPDSMGRTDFRFIADRPLQQAKLYIEPDTVGGMSGFINNLALFPDTSITSTKLSSSWRSWKASVTDSSGMVSESSGQAKFYFYRYGTSMDGPYPLTGLPIEFPLVLHGPWQRFNLVPPLYGRRKPWEPACYIVDLNPAGADSVVFTSLDSLAAAAMSSLVERYPTPAGEFRIVFAGPAAPSDSTLPANRMLFQRYTMVGTLEISACDGNYLLLQKLGLPSWFSAEYPEINYQDYRLPWSWLDIYGNK